MIWRTSKCSSSPIEVVSYSATEGGQPSSGGRNRVLGLFVHTTKFFSSGVKNVAFEGRSTITVCRGYQTGWKLGKTLIPREAISPTQTVAHPSRIYLRLGQLLFRCQNRTYKDPGPSRLSSSATHEGNTVSQDTRECTRYGGCAVEQPDTILKLITRIPKG